MLAATSTTQRSQKNLKLHSSQKHKADCEDYEGEGKKVRLAQDEKVLAVKDKKGVFLSKVTAKNLDKVDVVIRVRREDVVEIRTANDQLIGMDVDGAVYLADPNNCSEIETEYISPPPTLCSFCLSLIHRQPLKLRFRLERHRKGKKVAFYSLPYQFYLGVGGFLGRGTKLGGHKDLGHGELFEEQPASNSS